MKTTTKTVNFTAKELELLIVLASDQLFRREFIDPKMPGHRSNPEDITLGKALIARLQAILDPASTARKAALRVSKSKTGEAPSENGKPQHAI